MDDEGYVNIVGRIEDSAKPDGNNVPPREIEELLHTHPRISDVQVIGVPIPVYGEGSWRGPLREVQQSRTRS